ncbi:class I SAM-dependent methyltransferase [Flindersiella endophytica]
MSSTPNDMFGDEVAPPGVDITRPSPARMYDYYLSGNGEYNFRADREAAQRVMARDPDIRDAAWANRGFLQRASSWMAGEGIDQFLDIGAGLPTQNNTHDVVQAVNPHARIVYGDIESDAVLHGRQLIEGIDGVDYIQADVRDAASIFDNPVVTENIDLSRPVGVLIVACLQFVADPPAAIQAIMEPLAVGSYLAISHLTSEHQDPGKLEEYREIYSRTNTPIFFRSRKEIEAAFHYADDSPMQFVAPYQGAEPGVCWAGQWGAEDPDAADDTAGRWWYAGVARKEKQH